MRANELTRRFMYPNKHQVEVGDDGMVHCRTCGISWWAHDPGRKLYDYTCENETSSSE